MGAITFPHIFNSFLGIPAYWSDFFSGKVEPSTPHFWLIALTVFGGALVGLGIIWEAARDGHLWTLPTAMVFLGVVVEASATVVLFEFDEGISGAQTILTAAANKSAGEARERASSLEIEALQLREQLIAQGPREALLRGAIRKTLVDSLKPFAAQKIDVRFSSVTFFTSGGDWGSVPYGDDILGLSQTFIGILKDAMWNSPETPLPSNLRGRGLRIEVVRNAPQKTWRAAKALAVALQKVPLLVEGPNLIDEKEAKRVTNKVVLPELGSDTIILVVLTHP